MSQQQPPTVTPNASENHVKTGGEQIEFPNKVALTNEISPICFKVIEEIKIRRKHRYVVFKMGEAEIEVEKVGKRGETYEEFKAGLPFTDCRYCLYDQDYTTADGRPASKLWFVSWFPNNSNTYNKMAYTSAKGKFRETIPGVFDVQVSATEELDSALGLEKDTDDNNDDDDFDFN